MGVVVKLEQPIPCKVHESKSDKLRHMGSNVQCAWLAKKRNQILLLPENEAYSPIEVDLANQAFAIEGLSVGVIRQQI